MKENSFDFNLERFHKDVAEERIRILGELQKDVELHSGYRDIETRNLHFERFFQRQLNRIYEYSEPLFDQPGRQQVYFYTVTKAVCEGFTQWSRALKIELLADFFSPTSLFGSEKETLPQIIDFHKQILSLGSYTDSDYADRNLLADFQVKDIYPKLIRAFCLKEMHSQLSGDFDSPGFIGENMSKLLDTNLDAMINRLPIHSHWGISGKKIHDHFKILLETVKGFRAPIVSESDYISLIEAICENKILETPLALNLATKDERSVRRLFYDFYDNQIKKTSQRTTKATFLYMLENFAAFKGKTQNGNWLNNTGTIQQETTLNDLIRKNPKFPRQA